MNFGYADFRQLSVGQHVVGMRVEGDVYDRLLGAVMVRHPFEQLPHGFIQMCIRDSPIFSFAPKGLAMDYRIED